VKKFSDPRSSDPHVLSFAKMQGAGNDFVVLDARYRLPVEVSRIVPALADRHFGIGADGVILIESSTRADFRMVYFNRDGTRSVCGNGLRCAARFVYDLGVLPADIQKIKFEIDTGAVDVEIHNRGKLIRADMGRPAFDGSAIPTAEPGEHLKREFRTAAGTVVGSCVGMGNPHLVVLVPDPEKAEVEVLGPLLETDPFFPQRANISFAQIVNRSTARFRIWERGVGETLASGTGVCAVFAVGMKLGLLDPLATIQARGGEFQAVCGRDSGRIYLAGPAETVFTGQINIAYLLHQSEQELQVR
jgi:diaminopimelate epimerase